MIDDGGTPFYFFVFWHSTTPPSLAFTSTLYLLTSLTWSFCKSFLKYVLPWIRLSYNIDPLHLWVLFLEHEKETFQGEVGWHKMHLGSFVLFVYQLFHQHELDGKMPKGSWSYETAPTTLHCLQVTCITLSMLATLL